MKKWHTFFEYGTLEGCKVLKMPYKKGENPRSFSMYIFLPDDYDGLPSLMENIKIDSSLFKGQIKLKRVEISKLWIPKFNFDCDLSLSEPMKQLGLTLPFDGAGCDLTGMVEGTLTDERPYVGEVLQKCCIESNEKGTKAVAFIGYPMCYGASPPDLNPPPSTDFVVDHPFMFMIREDCSGTILFVGTVLDPTSS